MQQSVFNVCVLLAGPLKWAATKIKSFVGYKQVLTLFNSDKNTQTAALAYLSWNCISEDFVTT